MLNCRLAVSGAETSTTNTAFRGIEVKTLTPAERRALRARAHALHPTVMIGSAGLTDAVLKEIDLALKSHELIKIRMLGDDRDSREDALQRLCDALDAGSVQMIGKILVVFRPRPKEPEAPPAAGKPSVSPVRRGGAATAKAKRTRGRPPPRSR
jgi:putative YhbY family RNA-binding protein